MPKHECFYHNDGPNSARRHSRCLFIVVAAAVLLVLILPAPAQAYVGPGAGFGALPSFPVVSTPITLAIASLPAGPFRGVWRLVRGRPPPRAAIRRLIIVGLDGQDPKLTDQFMAEGALPNFSQLAKTGSYR